MSLKNTLIDIVTHLLDWEKKGLNEAQTRQVIILRILAELGFNIWQPFEIIAEESTSSNNYRPDFVIKLQRDCFVIEAKALGRSLSDSDVEQAINYVNSKGLRWAILTNGKEWKFFDNDLRGAASQRLAFDFSLQKIETESAVKYFEQLLSPKIWRQEHAAELVADAIRLIQLQKKLDELIPSIYSSTPAGLQKAIQNELTTEEQRFASQYFEPIAEAFSIDITAISESKVINSPLISSQPVESDILQRLRDKLLQLMAVPEKNKRGTIIVQIREEVVLNGSWQQLHTALAELLIDLHRESELTLTDSKNLHSYPESSYSQLSNGKFLLAHLSPSDHVKRVNKLLKMLNILDQSLTVNYKGESYLLPESP